MYTVHILAGDGSLVGKMPWKGVPGDVFVFYRRSENPVPQEIRCRLKARLPRSRVAEYVCPDWAEKELRAYAKTKYNPGPSAAGSAIPHD